MIRTVVKVSILRTWNSKQELLLIFVVPILFFSIFALIFSRGVGMSVKEVRVSVIDDEGSQLTQQITSAFFKRDEISSATGVGKTSDDWQIERLARALISQVGTEVVVYFPEGYGRSTTSPQLAGAFASAEGDVNKSPDVPAVRILNEGTNPISAQVVQSALAQAIAKQQVRHAAIPSAPVQLASTRMNATRHMPSGRSSPAMNFQQDNVFASNKHQPKVAMYAAGIAVMFLLFSASGAGASLLEEKEAGTLGRLLSSRLSVTQLLIGKWFATAGLGLLQITTMFLWGQVVFSVDLVGHLPGFIAMASATSAASASFALLLATLCRSRHQLNGVALVLVLGMSAIGGSMIPRYIMSDGMKRLGHLTFNGWALDGFKKIFWYDLPVSAIQTELGVLFGIAAGLGTLALLMANKFRMA
ncbi:MAG: ABC transporter permease [Planctomycetota bacterium]